MSHLQEGVAASGAEKRDSKSQINETTQSTTQVIPKLTVGLFTAQDLNGAENMNESGDKINQIENVK